MNGKRLGVRCQRKSVVLSFGLTGKPLLLFRHSCGVRSEESKRIQSVVKCEIIQFRPLVVDKLSGFVEALQGKCIVSEVHIRRNLIRGKAYELLSRLRSLLVLPLKGEHHAQIAVRN